MKKMGMVKNQGMCTFSILHRLSSALFWDIYENNPDRNYFAAEARNHAYYTVEINK
jgi:hypothetical protein